HNAGDKDTEERTEDTDTEETEAAHGELSLFRFRRRASADNLPLCALCSFLGVLVAGRARGLEASRALYDLVEHRPGVAAFGRPIRVPDGGIVCREDVLEAAVALHALRRELGDVELAGPLVAVLDQEPAAIAAAAARAGEAAAGAHEHPRSLQLV